MEPTTPKPQKRAFVKLDRYAIFDIARLHNLTTHEMALLLVLALNADFRSAEWIGTITELADYVRMSRTTLAKTFPRLAKLALIEMVQPFGPRSHGICRLLCYGQLIMPERFPTGAALALAAFLNERTAQICAVDSSESRSNREAIAKQSRSNREDMRDIDAATRTSATPRGREAVREGVSGAAGSPREIEVLGNHIGPNDRDNDSIADAPMCSVCNLPADDGHSYSHDPVIAPTEDEGAEIIKVAFGASR